MTKLKKLFFEIEFTWKRIIIFSVIAAAAVALLNLIPALQGTSFTDPAATTDVWFLFALVIIMNCKGYKEAALKTFVFFLISQPLIYLIEVPFVDIGWSVFRYYPYWGMLTIATLPGACLAYRVKKQDVISALILALANADLLCMVPYYYLEMDPPHIISMIFCVLLVAVFVFTLLSGKRERIIAIVIPLVCAVIFTVSLLTRDVPCHVYVLDNEHQWTVTSEAEDGIEAVICDDYRLEISPYEDGEYVVTVEDESGNEQELNISVTNDAQEVDVEDGAE